MRQKMLLLGAVFFGVIAFVLTYQQLEAERRSIRGTSQTVVLIRLTRNMVEGDELKQGDLARFETERRPTEGGLSREIPWSEVSRVIGRRLEVSMSAGQILQSTDLKPLSQRQGFSGVIQQDYRAVAIPVDPGLFREQSDSAERQCRRDRHISFSGCSRRQFARHGHAHDSAERESSCRRQPLGSQCARPECGAQLRHGHAAALSGGGRDDRILPRRKEN